MDAIDRPHADRFLRGVRAIAMVTAVGLCLSSTTAAEAATGFASHAGAWSGSVPAQGRLCDCGLRGPTMDPTIAMLTGPVLWVVVGMSLVCVVHGLIVRRMTMAFVGGGILLLAVIVKVLFSRIM